VGCQAHATLHKAYAWRAWQAMHRLCCVCAIAAMQLSIHACQCVCFCAGGPDLGCTDLRCPSTSRARTQQHTRRTACTSTRIAAAAEEGCMHALCTHALRTWYDMHSIAGHFLIPAKPKGWCDDGRVRTCKGGISRHHNTLQWQHTCCRLLARSVSKMRPFLKAPCVTRHALYTCAHMHGIMMGGRGGVHTQRTHAGNGMQHTVSTPHTQSRMC
jgi:hypothetical protein